MKRAQPHRAAVPSTPVEAERHPCILCAETAERRQPDPERDRYEYDCPECGRYATSHAGILTWPMALDTDRSAQIATIRRENAAGRRPTI